ncbi:DNA segregation ATPase FtsK/SpoIIIE-like protein [Bradyrhizobium japonicum]
MSFWTWLDKLQAGAPSALPSPPPLDREAAKARDRAIHLAESKKFNAEPFEVTWKRFVDDQKSTALQHYWGSYRITEAGDEALLAQTFGNDGRYMARLEADTARVIAELRAGRAAQLQVGPEPMQSIFLYDDEGAPGDTVNDIRRFRERNNLACAARDIEQVKAELLREAERVKEEAERKAAELKRQADQRAAEAKEAECQRRLAGPIPLVTTTAGIVFGTRIKDGTDFVVPLRQVQHMLISGVSGAGKTTFMHQILHQLVRSPEVERLVLIDLKGGVSFYRYRRSEKVEVYYEMADVIRVIDGKRYERPTEPRTWCGRPTHRA